MSAPPNDDNNGLLPEGQAHLDAFSKTGKTNKQRSRKKRESAEPTESSNIISLKKVQYEKVKYDADEVKEFLNVVFHDVEEDDDGEKVIGFFDRYTSHGYPLSETELLTKLRGTKAAKLYIGISTVTPTPDNLLRNRKDQFKRLHVIVLDDIGTKIPLDRIPKDFKPTYIVETSAGNFQYGYVLENPIDDYLLADTLINLVGSTGLTDTGGKLVMKKVRCPQGIHGKLDGPDVMFRTKLVTLDGPLWTPDAILHTLSIPHTWEEITTDCDQARQRTLRAIGASHWSSSTRELMTGDGVIDPVLEFLNEERLIINMDSEWVAIQCPNYLHHSDINENAAYYSPLGYGTGEYQYSRAFKCFHDSCSAYSTGDFLNHIVDSGGPHAAVRDLVGELTSSYVFDAISNKAARIKDVFAPEFRPLEAFKNAYSQPVFIHGIDKHGDLTITRKKQSDVWIESPERVTVDGAVFAPYTNARIITDVRGRKRLNMFTRPEFEGRIQEKHVDTFMNHVNYLIPHEPHAELFIDWLAAKLQDFSFRGWGIVMVAKKQGTGRGVLFSMLQELYHPNNAVNVPFEEIVGDSKFNEWREKPLVISDEAGTDDRGVSFWSAYNSLKEFIDPLPKTFLLNPKYGRQSMETITYTSHLMATNTSAHTRIDPDDRRLFVIANTPLPAEASYFSKLFKWRNTYENRRAVWLDSVGLYLLKRPVDKEALVGVAPKTEMREEMVAANMTPLDISVRAILDSLPSPFFTTNQVQFILQPYLARLGIDNAKDPKAIIRRVCESMSVTPKRATSQTVRLGSEYGSQVVRFRIRIEDAKSDEALPFTYGTKKDKKAIGIAGDSIRAINLKDMRKVVVDALDEAGR